MALIAEAEIRHQIQVEYITLTYTAYTLGKDMNLSLLPYPGCR